MRRSDETPLLSEWRQFQKIHNFEPPSPEKGMEGVRGNDPSVGKIEMDENEDQAT